MLQAPITSVERNTALPRMTSRRLNRWLKYALDFALVVPTLVLISPLLAIIALLIKADSPGPIVYRRRVVGQFGREFYAYKFRTMYIDNNDRLMRRRDEWMEVLRGSDIDSDPRLTRIGRFLRRTGLDELPRLFNVLDRSMSLVGPRMMTRTELMKFGHRIDSYTAVRPGLTGLWQVRGHSRNVDDRIRLETEYISNWSVLLDVQILLQTVLVAFTFHTF